MSVERVYDLAVSLKSLLEEEIVAARALRDNLRSLDGPALLQAASRREQFNDVAARCAEALSVALDEIHERPVPLHIVLSDIRKLSAKLHESDAFHNEVTKRMITCVRGYLRAVAAPPSAYNRHGGQMDSNRSTVSKRA